MIVVIFSLMKVRNLRSGVSRVAVVTLCEMFATLQKGMDQELDGTVRALLHKAGETNAFIRLDVERALDSVVQHCTLTRSMSALLAGGLGSDTHTTPSHSILCYYFMHRLCNARPCASRSQSSELSSAQVCGSASQRSGGAGRSRPSAVRC